MAQTDKTASLPGSQDAYRVHADAKKYTLRDNGFTETKSGKFQLIRTLGASVADQNAPKMKVVISKDLDDLKLSTVTANGLQKVNIYKGDKYAAEREAAEAIFYSLLEGRVLQKSE